MDLSLIIILFTIVLCFIFSLLLIRHWIAKSSQQDNLEKWVSISSQQINSRLDYASSAIINIHKNIGEITEIGRGIRSIEHFLNSPKLRGGIGEQILADMLTQAIPKNSFHLQYTFKSGAKVDAILKTNAGLICIDSKFPMENFEGLVNGDVQSKKQFISDVKYHISSISKKYIIPEEGTMDFALMYIPSENIYYEIVNTPELTNYARDNRVYPVSPNTFYAHLQIILVSFQGKELETKSKEVLKIIRSLKKDYSQVDDNLSTLTKHLNNATNQMQNVNHSFLKIGHKLSITDTLTDGNAES